jgi:hypothetical protein
MMSSSSAIGQLRRAQKEPAAVDHRHPQIECVAAEEIADQRQGGDAEADRDEGGTDPQSDESIDHHEIGRPKHAELAWRKMPERDRPENAERKEQHGCRDHSAIEAGDPHSPGLEGAERQRARETHHIHRNPDIAALPRPEIAGDVAGKDQHAPKNQHQAADLVGRRLTHAVGDTGDVRQRQGGFLRIDIGHDPLPALATSSAITDTAAGSLTIPM